MRVVKTGAANTGSLPGCTICRRIIRACCTSLVAGNILVGVCSTRLTFTRGSISIHSYNALALCLPLYACFMLDTYFALLQPLIWFVMICCTRHARCVLQWKPERRVAYVTCALIVRGKPGSGTRVSHATAGAVGTVSSVVRAYGAWLEPVPGRIHLISRNAGAQARARGAVGVVTENTFVVLGIITGNAILSRVAIEFSCCTRPACVVLNSLRSVVARAFFHVAGPWFAARKHGT